MTVRAVQTTILGALFSAAMIAILICEIGERAKLVITSKLKPDSLRRRV